MPPPPQADEKIAAAIAANPAAEDIVDDMQDMKFGRRVGAPWLLARIMVRMLAQNM